MIIQIIGLPGSGKTTFAKELCSRINAVHINADYVRATLNSDLGFSMEDRLENARRLGELARMLSGQGLDVVVDFICPTKETRKIFGTPDLLVWADRIQEGRFEDTNKMWEAPTNYHYRIVADASVEGSVTDFIEEHDLHDWKRPTTLLLGRYQPWHEGHNALLEAAYERTDQVLIAVRDTQGTSPKDPLSFADVEKHIIAGTTDTPFILKVPNITNIIYGRDVGYKIEQVKLEDEIETISATQKRREMGL